jgi:ribose-phosphate pyrophosphokinase
VNSIKVFGLYSTKEYAQKVAQELGVELSSMEEDYFDDGEATLRSEVNVRGQDVFVIQSFYTCDKERVADKIIKLLIFIGSLRDASARRITAVVPYLAYQRQDRKTASRAPIVTKYLAQWFQSVRLNRLLTIDTHNLQAFQNAFCDTITDHLEAKRLLATYVAENIQRPERISVMSPDLTGMNRARLFRNVLASIFAARRILPSDFEIPLCVLDKTHVGRTIQGHMVVGDVKDREVIIVDDVINSAKTMSEARNGVLAAGGRVWAGVATHGLFVGRANENLLGFERVIVTDTIKPYRLTGPVSSRLTVISTAKLFAEAIKRINEEDSISDLLA